MTVSSIRPVNNHWGNGSTTVFDFDFLIENQNELVVTHVTDDGIRTQAVFGVDYSIHEIGNKNGSYIVFPLENSSFTVLKNGELLSLALSLEIKQESEFHNSANLELDVLEWTFDYIIRIIQMLNSELSRTLKVKEGEDTNPDELLKSLNSAQKNCYIFSNAASLNYEKSLEQANQAKLSANIATEQATIATNKANEAINTVANTLNKTQITNCLLEVPQNIKLELKDGVLTLKAGSKVIVPNGVGVFNEVVINSDINFTYTFVPPTETPCMLFINASGTSFVFSRSVETCFSGTTQPSGNYRNWYNTTENKMYSIGGNATVDGSGFSFPIAMITQDSDGVTKSIDQVFNGIGYIGSHLFINKDVKGLIPNGFNSDGTLKNIEFTVPNVIVSSRELTQKTIPVWYRDNNTITFSTGWTYIESTNKATAIHDGVTTAPFCQIATVDMVNGVISNLRVKQPVHLVNYNDFNNSINTLSKSYITETYSNGSSGYNIWSNKYCEQWGIAEEITGSGGTVTISLLKSYKDTEYIILTESKGEYQATGQANDSVVTVTSSSFTIHSGMTRTCRKIWKTSGFLA